MMEREREMSEMFCNPDKCLNCQYIGEGDSLCDITMEVVLSDWVPTENAMGPGCPYREKMKKGRQRKR